MDEEEDDGDDVDEERESQGYSFYFGVFLMFFLLMSGSVLVMYRAARPRELDSLFEVFDVNFESQQVWLEQTIEDIFGYFEVCPPRNPPRRYKSTSPNQPNSSSQYWIRAYETLRRKNPKLKMKIETKLKELKRLRKKKSKYLTDFKTLNQGIKSAMMEKLKFSDPSEAIDRIFNEIYRKQFDILVCEAMIKDFKLRIRKIEAIIEYSKSNGFVYEQLPNKIFEFLPISNKLTAYKIADKIIKRKSILDKSSITQFEEWNQTQSQLTWSISPSPTNLSLSTTSAVIPPRENESLVEVEFMKIFQGIEEQIFILKQRDLEYFERIQEIDHQIKIYDQFIKDLLHDLNKNEKISSSTKWKHLYKQSDRIGRLKQVYKAESAQFNLFAGWHRRNLLKIYTKIDLFSYDKVDELAKKVLREFYEKFGSFWNIKMDRPEMFTILSEKGRSDEFNLDLALQKYFEIQKYCETNDPTIFESLQNGRLKIIKEFIKASGFATKLVIFPDFMILSVAALYRGFGDVLEDEDETKFREIRANWPRISGSFFN